MCAHVCACACVCVCIHINKMRRVNSSCHRSWYEVALSIFVLHFSILYIKKYVCIKILRENWIFSDGVDTYFLHIESCL